MNNPTNNPILNPRAHCSTALALQESIRQYFTFENPGAAAGVNYPQLTNYVPNIDRNFLNTNIGAAPLYAGNVSTVTTSIPSVPVSSNPSLIQQQQPSVVSAVRGGGKVQKKYQGPTINCQVCGQQKKHEAKGMCKTCYNRAWKENKKADKTKYRQCTKCSEVKLIEAREMCKKCYSQAYKKPGKSTPTASQVV